MVEDAAMPSTRREFMKAAACAGMNATFGTNTVIAESPGKKRPNILLLFPDQWRFDWMSTNPELNLRTPNLDQLRRLGTSFSRAVVAAPVCGPSRACLASGMEYVHQNVNENAVNYQVRQTTIYSSLRNAGYHVLGCGKMDLAKGANWWGVDGKWRTEQWGFTNGINMAGKWDQLTGIRLNNNKPADPYTAFLDSSGLLKEHVADYERRRPLGYSATFPTPLPDTAYSDNWVTDTALSLLSTAPESKPWFLQVNWPGPHDPEDITVSMERSVRGRPMPVVNGRNEFDAATNQLIRQNYSAMCENIDHNVGRLLDHLETTRQSEDTVVIFSSDHGEMLGDHGRWGKTVPYQPSVSVPMILKGSGFRAGVTSDALVSSIDLSATILDLAGADHASMDGRTLSAVLQGKIPHHRDVVYSGLGAWRMAWDGQYKVITGFDPSLTARNDDSMSMYEPVAIGRPVMVFDSQRDKAEQNPLKGSLPPQATELLSKLRSGSYPA
jgi:arylsulfatase